MAKMDISANEEYLAMLDKISIRSDGISKMAIYQGAKTAYDAIIAEAKNIPTEPFRMLKGGEQMNAATAAQKDALIKGFGIAKMEHGSDGWNTKIGVDGYASGTESKKYPKGLPLPLLARAIESGSSVRKKFPFIRRAVNRCKEQAVGKMAEVIEREYKKLVK